MPALWRHSQVEAAVTDLGDGAYDVHYCIERSGLYELKVELPGADGGEDGQCVQ